MSEAESLQVFSSLMQGGYTALSLYLTTLSGYLVVAYLVGRKLTNFQLRTVSFLFLSFSIVLLLGGLEFFRSGMQLLLSMGDNGSDIVLRFLAYGVYVLAAIQIIGVILAMKFMHNERRKVDA